MKLDPGEQIIAAGLAHKQPVCRHQVHTTDGRHASTSRLMPFCAADLKPVPIRPNSRSNIGFISGNLICSLGSVKPKGL
jgi:hypothetical protein